MFLGWLPCSLNNKHCNRVVIVCETCDHLLSALNVKSLKFGAALVSTVEADLPAFYLLVTWTSPCSTTSRLPPVPLKIHTVVKKRGKSKRILNCG